MHAFNKVFGLGFWRTGTTSLTEALQIIGIRCKHYPWDGTTQRELWSESLPLTLLERYDAVTDISVVPFYKSLDGLYPGSKFILTVREHESWLESMRKQIERAWNSALMENTQFRAFTEAISERVYGGVTFDPDRLIKRYNQHVFDVTEYFAERPQDLLVMDVIAGDGWEKLCPFLDLPIPEAPFPHKNPSRQDPLAWDRKVRTFLETLQSLDVEMNKTLLLDDATLHAYVPEEVKPIPFPGRNGMYAGRPRDGHHARRFLLTAIADGAQTLVVTWPSFWWLEEYPQFVDLLDEHFTVVLETELVTVYDLSGGAAIS